MITKEELSEALVDLFDGWMKPHVQFSAASAALPLEIRKLACQFYALNCYAFESAFLSPQDLITRWSKRTDIKPK